jgi:hypothetical protein
MNKVLVSTLALGLAAGGAFADTHASTEMDVMDLYEDRAQLIRSRDITGGDIYTNNAADDEGWDSVDYTEVGADWNDIGEIEDLILSRDGQVIGIVAEIGGFLDIADKHVMIPVQDLRLVPVDDRNYVYVTRYSEEQLEELEGVDEGFWD